MNHDPTLTFAEASSYITLHPTSQNDGDDDDDGDDADDDDDDDGGDDDDGDLTYFSICQKKLSGDILS